MKKIFFLVVSILILFNSNVKAASLCDYKEQAEINGKAANVKASYEIVEETIHFDDGDAIRKMFEVTILNVTEEFYVVVKNNLTEKEMTFKYSDSKNGIVTFEIDDTSEVTNLTIEIYTNSKTNCPDERFRTLYLTLPRYNEFSRRSICENYTDFYLCQKFVTFSKVSEDTFLKQLENYKQKAQIITDDNDEIDDNNEKAKNVFEYINEYKWIIVGSFVFVIVVIVIIAKSRSKKPRDFK